MAASVIPVFTPGGVDMFLELMESYFVLNKTKDDCKVHALVMGMGSERYSTIRDLVHPRKPAAVPYGELADVLRAHYGKPRNRMLERAGFRDVRRGEGESVCDFVARLRGKAAHCGFGPQLEENLLEQFTMGVNSSSVRTRLLQLSVADQGDFHRVIETAKEVEIQGLMTSDVNVGGSAVHWVKAGARPKQEKHKFADQVQCYRCSRKGHTAASPSCPAKGKACRDCGETGHFAGAKFCKRRGRTKEPASARPQSFQQRSRRVREIKETAPDTSTAPDESTAESGLFTLQGTAIMELANNQKPQPGSPGEEGRAPRILVHVCNESFPMVVDSGACANILDKETVGKLDVKLSPTTKQLYAFGSTCKIPLLGCFRAVVSVGSAQADAWFYVFDGQADCLLSYDTAKALGVLSMNAVSTVSSGDELATELRNQYPHVFNGIGRLKGFSATLHVDETATAVAQPVRRLPLGYRAKVEQHIRQLLEADVIEPVEGVPTGWVSPLVCVPKDSGEIRMTVDMRRVNEAVVRERHPIPTVRDMLSNLEGAKVFSKLDLKQGFHQIELAENSRDVTTFVSPFGLFRYKRLSMGLNAAPEIFQYAVQKALAGLSGVQNLADDIILWGSSKEEHDQRAHALMQRLGSVGLTLNPSKCAFGLKSVKFLGFIVSTEGISADPRKVQSILSFGKPANQTDCRSFLGLVNFVGQFVPDLATLSEPIRRVSGKTQVFEWGTEQAAAFEAIKRRLADAETLAHFDCKAPTRVVADASPCGLGAVLTQLRQGVERVIAYAHRSLTPVERRYSQTEKESLALVWACEHFRHYLLGITFTLVTDHKPLQQILGNSSSKPVPRIERWALRLQSFRFTVMYRPGKANIADPLSRLPGVQSDSAAAVNVADEYIRFVAKEAVPVALSWEDIRKASCECEEMKTICRAVTSGDFQACALSYQSLRRELSTCDGVVMRGFRIVIPQVLRKRVLELGHEGHQGMVKCKQRVRESVWWPGIDRDVERMCSRCDVCVRVNGPNAPTPLQMTEMPTKPWVLVGFDLLGPLPDGRSVAVVVDYYSRYVEAGFLRSTTTDKIVDFLDSIFSRQGYPETLRSDNGPQMVSAVFRSYLDQCGIRWLSTTPLWAQANGLVERNNQGLLKSLRVASANKCSLEEELRRYLVAYRSTPHSSTGVAPFTLLTGRKMRTKLPRVHMEEDFTESASAREADAVAKMKAKQYADNRRRASESDIQVGDLVYLKQNRDNKLTACFGPAKLTVTARSGAELTCRDEQGTVYRRNVSHAKRCPVGVGDAEGDDYDRIEKEGRNDVLEKNVMNGERGGSVSAGECDLETEPTDTHKGPWPGPTRDFPRRGDRVRRPPARFKD